MKKYSDIWNQPRKLKSDKWEHYFDIYDHCLSSFYDKKISFLDQPQHIDRCFHHIKDRKNTAIDAEGYENQVVLGAKETLLRNKPIIIIIEQKGFSNRFNESQFEAIDTLKSYGAKVIDQVVKDFILSW